MLFLRTHLLGSSAAVLAILSASPAAAADEDKGGAKLEIEGSTRARVEAIAGEYRPGAPADETFVSFRTNLAVTVDAGPVRIGGELIDARGYAEDKKSAATLKEFNALEPVQAYVTLSGGDLLGKGSKSALTLGRFSMDFGGSRLIGRTDFPNVVISYAGVRFDWTDKAKDRLLAFWTQPFTVLPDDAASITANQVQLDRAGKNIQFWGAAFARAKLVSNVSGELYVFRLAEHDGMSHLTRDRRLVTYGFRLRRAPAARHFDFELAAAGQGGTARATTAASDRKDLTVEAGFAHAEAGWTFAGGWTPRVSAQFDIASGDGPDPNHYGRFDTLFGARRSDFGPTALDGPIQRANLISPGARIEVKPAKTIDAFFAVHGLWLAEPTDSFAATGVRDKTGRSGSFAGTQLEARVRDWIVPKKIRLECGATYLAKGQFLRDAPNAPDTGDTRYGYVELAFQF